YSASATRTSYPAGVTGPPVHPSEPAYPCCLPALGRFTGCTPHEGLRQLYPLVPGRRAWVSSSAEDSPRGLGRTLGKRVGLTPSRVRISYPPPVRTSAGPARSRPAPTLLPVRVDLVTIVVEEYDPAIEFFTGVLGFELVEDSPSLTNDGRPKRWVVVRPPGAGTGILLARPDGGHQAATAGNQAAGG